MSFEKTDLELSMNQEFLVKDGVALYSNGEDIFSLFPSIKDFLESWGWEFLGNFIISFNIEYGNEQRRRKEVLTEAYIDSSGNSLSVDFERFTLPFPLERGDKNNEKKMLFIDCYRISDITIFYGNEERGDREEKLDFNKNLNKYLEFYGKNRFKTALEKIKKRLAEKEEELKKMYS